MRLIPQSPFVFGLKPNLDSHLSPCELGRQTAFGFSSIESRSEREIEDAAPTGAQFASQFFRLDDRSRLPNGPRAIKECGEGPSSATKASDASLEEASRPRVRDGKGS
jgi:hypothetical protein